MSPPTLITTAAAQAMLVDSLQKTHKWPASWRFTGKEMMDQDGHMLYLWEDSIMNTAFWLSSKTKA